MSTATSGRRKEYQVRDDMLPHGWEPIFRAAGSKGPADIGMAHELHGLALIQVGTRNKTLGPADRARLLRAAWLCSALPILAQVIPTPGKATEIRYWHVTPDTARHWQEWHPNPEPLDSTEIGDLPA